jgi:hypothetical protein
MRGAPALTPRGAPTGGRAYRLPGAHRGGAPTKTPAGAFHQAPPGAFHRAPPGGRAYKDTRRGVPSGAPEGARLPTAGRPRGGADP